MSIKSVLSGILPAKITRRILTIGRVVRYTRDSKTNQYIDVAVQMALDPGSYIRSTGYLDSKLSFEAFDNNGKPIPWMPYPITNFLSERIESHHRIFEYGSGFSTRFFSARAGAVRSVEYDGEWFGKVNDLLRDCPNAEVIFQEVGDAYPKVILRDDTTYHIVVVDGRMRVKCGINAVERLTQDGVIILDDSEREKYKPLVNFLSEMGFRSLTFSGLKPLGWQASQTTIFYKTENCLNI